MDKGQYSLPSVILGRTSYGEADLVITFMTREQGKISGLAKHGRKSRKRFGNILSSLALVKLDFTVTPGRELVRLDRGDLIRNFDALAKDLNRLGLASYALELVSNLCAPLDPAPEVFDLLIWFLGRIDSGERPEEAVFIFQLRFLKLTGFGPNISACPLCGRSVDAEQALSMKQEHGGVVCRSCVSSGYPVSFGALKLMELAQTLKLDKVDRVRTSSRVLGEVGPFLRAYITYTIGRELKSVQFMEQLKKSSPTV
ncbi:MAG: DNA repair protein RecO [Deltaproteobacteria bacterium]|nr:DNA repair protein RecO [Deltaproteobacteria bacterium]MBW2050639.1 DNA repair protein RecO [Deltaproteobacteria bacterium]MBW2139467.1 DNA repair protein RecO [Deltaproteobacteria bacterium]MBW2322216.1 DNA repair protein RecO [Deltaproteobacteria bacterium]